MGSDRLQQWLLRVGLIILAVLLVRFAVDFSTRMKWWLAAPFCGLVAVALTVGGANIIKSARRVGETHATARLLLLGAIPLGFLASSLGCTGLSWQGCSTFCTFVKVVWVPLIAVVSAGYFFARREGWLSSLLAMSFVPLMPHCVCYNVGNAWWIERIGASPLCYGWGFAVSILAVGTLRTNGEVWPSLLVCFTIIAGASGFFISHHYFHFPW